MRLHSKITLIVLAALMLMPTPSDAAGINATQKREIGEMLTRIVAREVSGGSVRVDRTRITNERIEIYASIGLSYYPFREENVAAIYDSVRTVLPAEYADRKLSIITDNHRIEEFIPHYYRTSNLSGTRFTNRSKRPLVRPLSSQNAPTEGLAGRHIAMWQSHGRYFDQKENVWRWQRSRLWETVEDLFTQSFVLPYLVPMLENAGANVLLPRERDTQLCEIIIDNDSGVDDTTYAESNGSQAWGDNVVGFAHLKDIYMNGENPFRDGTTRAVKSITSGDESRAEWRAAIPETGEYAVYVSYASHGTESADDAVYTVHHLGGESRFAVNQTMGGGMWIYLGHFPFAAGEEQTLVSLSNITNEGGRTVSADAVKIGGGYGNIAREVSPSLRDDAIEYEPLTSEYPRFCEGARYWLQWSGFDEDVYTPKEGADDYKDDYMSRAHWVNALMGGSERLPDEKGKSIPIDMALAFHSDAGVRLNDDIIGTLGIFYTKDNKGHFMGGADRYLSRELTDIVMTQMVEDIRSVYEPAWSRRGMWNRSYYEARVPCAPTMLLESLSHQNFADMRYGNDPRFKFFVSRSIYKGILRYLSSQYNVPYTVQPLPVEAFSVEFADEDTPDVVLSWQPVTDSLELSADPDYYIVYTRQDDGGFDNGTRVDGTTVRMTQQRGHTYSYRVTAVNKGGESFPSETLAAHRAANERGSVLVINGFERVSAPMNIQGDSLAGFYNDYDSGAAYIKDISFIGQQRNFDRALSRSENDNDALGSCYSDYETRVIAGNTFDYPVIHGRSIAAAGYSFCSASVKAVERGDVILGRYDAADLILGKQRSCAIGRGTSGYDFKVMSESLQRLITDFTRHGGNIFVSGCHVAGDLWKGPEATSADKEFARRTLHMSYNGDMATRRGEARIVASPMGMTRSTIEFNREPTRDFYGVESPGCISPYGRNAYIAMRYATNNQPAAVCYNGNDYRSVVMAFPFESILDASQRDMLMRGVLAFFERSGGDE